MAGQDPTKEQGQDPTGQGDGGKPPNTQQGQGADPEVFSREYVQELRAENAKWRTQLRELEQWRDKREKEAKDAKEAELREQNKWKEIAEQRERELEAERLERLRLQVATTKGLPAEMAGRLRGTTQDELEADADELLKFAKPTEGKGVPPSGGKRVNPQTFDLESMTPEQIREKKSEIWRAEIG